MKIIQLSSENVKRLHAVQIKPNGNVVVIGGKNGQGKSSVLDSIQWALGGEPDAKMPVRRGGIPFEQCSSAEQLGVSVAIGLALNPKLRVLLIRDGSLLDENSLKLVAEMAAKADAQVWLERVGKDAATSVVIEDGRVAPELPPKPEPAIMKEVPTEDPDSSPGDNGSPCPECSAIGQHYRSCSHFEE